ncbi:MAG: 6-bladed beta-propeller [Coriobacteriia bacterium]
MTRRQKRLLAIVIVLAILLALLGGYFYYYAKTKQLKFNLAASAQGTVAPPVFLYSFSGTGADRLQRPIGVLLDNGTVYVADSLRARILTFTEDGKMTGSFGSSQTVTPLNLAKNPKDGNIYVTDRRKFTVWKFKPDGTYVGEFKPDFPADQLPVSNTMRAVWQPIAIAFGADGTMYVTELLKGHRLLIFAPDGKFQRSIGFAGIVENPTTAPEAFQFPNGVMVANNELYVSDSNNRRVKVYDLKGNFKLTIVTAGLPRGLAALAPFPSDDVKSPGRFVLVDTLAHDATIWTMKGAKILSFGEQGLLDGQFSYPNGIARNRSNKMFIADTANGRIDVWGWPAQVAGLPEVNPRNLWPCLLPLLLLPFLFFLRKREFFATSEFVESIIRAGEADLMPKRRRVWHTTLVEYELIKLLETDTVKMADLFSAVEYSESDVNALVEKYEIEREEAVTLASSARAYLFCTEVPELRRMAKLLEIDVVNAGEFIERFGQKEPRDE